MIKNCQQSLKFAIIGAPNVGKSLLTNQLVQANVAAVSRCMDTTRSNLTATITNDFCQLVAVDSPGLVGIQHATSISAGKDLTILTDPEKAMKKAEHVLVVQDSTHLGDYIHHRILYLLHRYSHIPSTLVINKVDLISDRSQLLPLVKILTNNQVDGRQITSKRVSFGRLGRVNEDRISQRTKDGMSLYEKNEFFTEEGNEKWKKLFRQVMGKSYDKCPWNETKTLFSDIRGWSNFKAVFFVSSLTGEGIDVLRNHLIEQSSPGRWIYDKDTLTTKDPKDICLDQVRAECLNYLPSHIGYGINIRLMDWSLNYDILNIIVELICIKKNWIKFLLQRNPSTLNLIEEAVNKVLQNLINQPLNVKLIVKFDGKTVTADNFQNL